ncbi:MAG: Ig-like domain-containing protein, partial [Acidimicrobiales bacterium]
EPGVVGSGTVTISGPAGEICAVPVGSGGLLHCTTSTLGVGTDQITASYAGTATIAASKGATTVTVTAPATAPVTGATTGGGSSGSGGGSSGASTSTGGGGGTTHHKNSPHHSTTHQAPTHPVRTHPTVPVVPVSAPPVASPPVAVVVPVHPQVLATATYLSARRIGRVATLLSSRTFAAGIAVRSGVVSFIGPDHEVLCSGVAVSATGRATCRTYLLPRSGATVLAVYAPSARYKGSRSLASVPALHESPVTPAPVTAVGHPKPAVAAPVTSCPTAVAPKGATKWAETYLAKDVFFWLLLVMLGLLAFWQRARGRRGPEDPGNDDSAALAEALYAAEGE